MSTYARYISETEIKYPEASEFIGVINWQSHDSALRAKGYVPLIGEHETPEGYKSEPVKFKLTEKTEKRTEPRPVIVPDYDPETGEKTGEHTEWKDTEIEFDASFITVLEWEDTEIVPSLEEAISSKLAELDAWDNAELPNLGVNWFTISYNGTSFPFWIKKADRAALLLTMNAAQADGKESITVWASGNALEIPVESGVEMLYAIETYASECYCVTEGHRKTIQEMMSAKSVINYDFKTGYPEHPSFTF